MRSAERGMALVTVLLVVTLLMIMATVLTDKIGQTTRQVIANGQRERTLWAANAGIELARRELALHYQSTNGWQSYLQDRNGRYPQIPSWTFTVDQLPVTVFLRDNRDGDGDLGRDNDLKLFVLARAQAQRGPELLVECLCGFADGVTGAGLDPSGAALVGGETRLPVVLAEEGVRYGVGD